MTDCKKSDTCETASFTKILENLYRQLLSWAMGIKRASRTVIAEKKKAQPDMQNLLIRNGLATLNESYNKVTNPIDKIKNIYALPKLKDKSFNIVSTFCSFP